jgi:hypothetical protein
MNREIESILFANFFRFFYAIRISLFKNALFSRIFRLITQKYNLHVTLHRPDNLFKIKDRSI